MPSIAAQLKRIREKSEVKVEKIIRSTYFEVFNSVLFMSPRDSGLFESNWQAGFSIDKSLKSNTGVGAVQVEISQELAKIDFVNEQVFYFTNSLPYAYRLENGWSEQAAHGMVGVVSAQFETIAQGEINRFK